MVHKHPVYDTDPHFSIHPDNRSIEYTSSEDLILIQGDHNSEVYTFEIPRYVDGHDMMLCNLIQVHYINMDGNNANNRNTGVYEIIDMQLSKEDENVCVCSWTISGNATLFVGRLSFALRFACMEGTKLTYVWNSAVYDGVSVSTGYNNSTLVVNQYADVLEAWYWEFVSATTTGVNVIDLAKERAIAEIASVGGIVISDVEPELNTVKAWFNTTDSTLRVRDLETGEFKVLDSIKGEKGEKGDKGDKGDPGDYANITQEFGDSETLVISQKVISDKISEIENIIDDNQTSNTESFADINNRLTTTETNIGTHTTRILEFDDRVSSTELDIIDVKKTISNEQSNISNLTDRVSTNETNIAKNSSDIIVAAGGVAKHESDIALLTDRVSTNETNITALQQVILGQMRIATGTYVGTGERGGTHNRIDLDFKPLMLILRDDSEVYEDLILMISTTTKNDGDYYLAYARPRPIISSDKTINSSGHYYAIQNSHLNVNTEGVASFWRLFYKFDDAGVEWYTFGNAEHQYNTDGTTYSWTVIGTEV